MYLLEWSKWKIVPVPRVLKDLEQPKVSYTASVLENSLDVSKKKKKKVKKNVKHRYTILCSYPGYSAEGNKTMCPDKDLYKNVNSSFICTSPKLAEIS